MRVIGAKVVFGKVIPKIGFYVVLIPLEGRQYILYIVSVHLYGNEQLTRCRVRLGHQVNHRCVVRFDKSADFAQRKVSGFYIQDDQPSRFFRPGIIIQCLQQFFFGNHPEEFPVGFYDRYDAEPQLFPQA